MSQRVNGTASPARQKLKRRSFVALGVAGGALGIAQWLAEAAPASAAPSLPSLAPVGRSGVPRLGCKWVIGGRPSCPTNCGVCVGRREPTPGE